MSLKSIHISTYKFSPEFEWEFFTRNNHLKKANWENFLTGVEYVIIQNGVRNDSKRERDRETLTFPSCEMAAVLNLQKYTTIYITIHHRKLLLIKS